MHPSTTTFFTVDDVIGALFGVPRLLRVLSGSDDTALSLVCVTSASTSDVARVVAEDDVFAKLKLLGAVVLGQLHRH